MATVTYTSIGGRIIAENRGGTRKFYSSDALGSTVALYDNSATKTDSFKYWPYGETRTSTGSTPTKYKFVGTLGCREQADGGIYMRARVELPKDGRWMTVDPLWPREPAYRYAGSNPSNFVDPLGFGPELALPLLGPAGWIALGVIALGCTAYCYYVIQPRIYIGTCPVADDVAPPAPVIDPITLPDNQGRGRPLPRLGPPWGPTDDPECKRQQDECNEAPPPGPGFSCWQCYRRCLIYGEWPNDRGCDYKKRQPKPIVFLN